MIAVYETEMVEEVEDRGASFGAWRRTAKGRLRFWAPWDKDIEAFLYGFSGGPRIVAKVAMRY